MEIKTNNKKNKYPWKRLCLSVAFPFFYLFFSLYSGGDLKQIDKSDHPVLYANKCHDNFRSLLVSSIKQAEKGILLKSFSLNEDLVCHALVKKSQEGIPISVKCHKPVHIQKLIEKAPCIHVENKLRSRGSMHQKILVIDSELVWLGSANISKESLVSDDNLLLGLKNKELAQLLLDNRSGECMIGNQLLKLWLLPHEKSPCLKEIIHNLNMAKKSIKIAMFCFSHPKLITAVAAAYERGVGVEIIIDSRYHQFVQNSSFASCISLGTGTPCTHHKFAWIDESVLILGSANWTKHGFGINEENVIVLNNLTPSQNNKLDLVWKEMSYRKKPLLSLKVYKNNTTIQDPPLAPAA